MFLSRTSDFLCSLRGTVNVDVVPPRLMLNCCLSDSPTLFTAMEAANDVLESVTKLGNVSVFDADDSFHVKDAHVNVIGVCHGKSK